MAQSCVDVIKLWVTHVNKQILFCRNDSWYQSGFTAAAAVANYTCRHYHFIPAQVRQRIEVIFFTR